jgi:hypothetical protein
MVRQAATFSLSFFFCLQAMDLKSNIITLTADCKNVGVILTPSVKKVKGANMKKDITVIIEKRLMLSKDSCTK